MPPTVWFTIRGFPFHVPRTPRRFFNEMSGNQALFPLIILAGLVFAYNLDQTVFGILAPDIKNAFNLSNQGYLTLVALTQLGGLLLAIPLAYYSDRLPRVALIGAKSRRLRIRHRSLLHAALLRSRSAVGRRRAVDTDAQLADGRLLSPEVRP
jgi:MFS family permease